MLYRESEFLTTKLEGFPAQLATANHYISYKTASGTANHYFHATRSLPPTLPFYNFPGDNNQEPNNTRTRAVAPGPHERFHETVRPLVADHRDNAISLVPRHN